MRRFAKLAIIVLALACPALGHANITRTLSDSITQFVQKYANINRVHVFNFQQHNNKIAIHANELSYVSLSPQDIQLLKKSISKWCGEESCSVKIYTGNYEIEELVTMRYRSRRQSELFHPSRNTLPLSYNLSQPYSVTQGLNSRHLAIWGSHGLCYMKQHEMWKWQRARLWTTVEDLYTTSYLYPFLVPMLERAGAVVLQPRERDIQTDEYIVDDDDIIPGSTDWTTADQAGFANTEGPLLDSDNPFRMGHYLLSPCHEDSTISYCTYYPMVNKEDQYALYVSYASLPKSTDKAHYTIVHNGQTTHIDVNQQMGGGIWIYLGTFTFGRDPYSNYIQLSNQGDPRYFVSTDAIKIGGGMGSVARYPLSKEMSDKEIAEKKKLAMVSSYPRFMEAARYWLQYSGFPDSIYSISKHTNDKTDDLVSRGLWVNYLAGGSSSLPSESGLRIPLDLCLAVHSDAGTRDDESVIGTLTIYTDTDQDAQNRFPAGGNRLCSRDFADRVQTQIVEDIRSTLCPEWTRRAIKNESYSETRRPKIPSAIIEMLSHQNYKDMQLGLNSEFKFVVSRAIYKAILRYLHDVDQSQYTVQPLPVRAFKIEHVADDSLRLCWRERVDSLEPTAHPTYYVLYSRPEGKDWDNGILVHDTAIVLPIEYGIQYDYKVCAGNDGGISLDSETLSACIFANSTDKAIIINGFSQVRAPRMDAIDSITGGILPGENAIPYGKEISYLGQQFEYNRQHLWRHDDDCGFGMCYSDFAHEITVGNTFDYPVLHGKVFAQMGISFVSSSLEAVDNLSPYSLVDVIMGKQNHPDGCLPESFRESLQRYLSSSLMVRDDASNTHSDFRHGKLLMSGSYLGSSMQNKKNQNYTTEVLHYCHHAAFATHSGCINMAYPVLPQRIYHLYTQPNSQTIECEAPDGIVPTNGANRLGFYDDSGICAGIAYQHQLIVLPFMMESLQEFDVLLQDCVHYLMSEEVEEANPDEAK